MGTRREARYRELRAHWFLPREARELSVLPKATPALKALVADRDARRARFEKVAASKVARGVWKRSEVGEKWLKNLSRLYTKYHWRVKHGPVGGQPKMAKGSTNPWAMYRAFERDTPGKGYVSPWEIRQIARGKTRLEKGLIFIQQLERKSQKEGGISNKQIESWIRQKDESIKSARGRRRAQLIIEKHRLERLL